MNTSRHPALLHWKSPRHARRFFALGILAMFLHILAGMGFMGSHSGKADSNASAFSPQICTVLGISPAPEAGTANHTPDDTGSMHNCCTLCVASSPLLFANLPPAVSPTPTFSTHFSRTLLLRRASPARTAHSPRGPPALA